MTNMGINPDRSYEYGMDQLMVPSRTITPATEAQAEEVYRAAITAKPLPTGYTVKAVIACLQVDPFRLEQCGWTMIVESRRETVQTNCRRRLAAHYRHAHPSFDEARIKLLIRVVNFNFRDFGR